MSPKPFHYAGDELDIFCHARRWKAYWSSRIQPWIDGDVLEVGAGLGANTPHLQTPGVRSWHCLEPDESLARRLGAAVAAVPRCSITIGTIQSISGNHYDAILYIDVLEHIEDDRTELARAAEILRPGGRLIVLSPAHQLLFSKFDAAIGHFRRYDRSALRSLSPRRCELETLSYLDSAGMLTSMANRLLLRQARPSLGQILFWDRYIVPISRVLDPLLRYRLGKSILSVWKRM